MIAKKIRSYLDDKGVKYVAISHSPAYTRRSNRPVVDFMPFVSSATTHVDLDVFRASVCQRGICGPLSTSGVSRP